MQGREAADVEKLISLAEAAAVRAQWLEVLDFAAQALAADAGQRTAANLVGTARRQLGAVSAPSAELRQITVVAVDMVRSTTVTAALGPERMRELMLDLYGVCAEAITRYDGRVTKYTGDGVLAQFGYPIVHEDDARRAVLASLALIEEIEQRTPAWEARYGEPPRVRVGIDSGVAAVGPVDTSPWSGEEIAGDPPNIATRVEATAEPMTVRITEATNELIKGWFETLPVGPVELRNYPEPVTLYRLLEPTKAETRLEAQRGTRPPLLGRDTELAALLSAWKDVSTAGRRRIVGLTGEPGIGKSRLVEHLNATGVATGAAQVTFACSRLYRDSSLRPVARALVRFFRLGPTAGGSDAVMLDGIRRQLEQLPGRRLATEDAVPIYGWLLGIRSAVDLEPEQLRRRGFDAVIDLLETIAANSNLVLCIDDIDMADPSTVELVRALLARPAVPMLVVPTGRGPLPELPGEMELLELGGLPAGEAAGLVRAVAPHLEEQEVERIVAGSDGVPYLLEEQARASGETGFRAVRTPTELAVFLAARLDELGGEYHRLLGEVAVAGEQVSVEALRELSSLSGESLEQALAELVRRRILMRETGPGGDAVRFRHGLMREAAYDGLLEAERARLHRAIAGFLAERAPAGAAPEDLARHYELALEDREAARWWLEAGRVAVAGGANAEAGELFRRGLAPLARLPEDPERAGLELELQLGLGTVLSTLEGYTSPAARGSFERAVVLGESLADTATIFPALWGVWAYWFTLGEHRVAAGLAQRCLRIAEDADAHGPIRFEAAAIVGYQRLYLGEFEGARSELALAGEHVAVEPTPVFPHDPGTVSRSALAVALWFVGDAVASRQAAEEALALAEGLDPANRRAALTEAWVACTLAWRAELDGDPELAIELAERAADIAVRRGYATWLAAATLHRSIALCSLGRRDEGLPVLAATVEAWRGAGRDATGRQLHPVLMTPYFAGRLAEVRLASGQPAEALAEIDDVLARTRRNNERFWDAELLRLRARASELCGAPAAEVRADLKAARRLAAEQGAGALAERLAGEAAPS